MAGAKAAKDERRDDYRWWMPVASRWADCDAYGHVNNAVYYNWFDTALTTLAIERGILRAPGQTSIGLCIASGCEFLAPVGFPETVDVGIRLGRIGNSSLRYELAIFPKGSDTPAAVGHFVHVYVDAGTRRSVALTEAQKASMSDLTAESFAG
ncbi:acyl-CoA thioesterase [Reyranella aquatilis]|jgi:acyl-CoA thioester hydrolase|uniref:Acyl-CoA thioesterase n=1 Tax=Reyranella aquatilis TaxID=2035356 RepID=A0ABS8L1U9_9HYPH|nr:thioesterase family protein [Reyranella aquatilis]MCC8432328.1 acyl-CoA thioesterase [Reyranella aquatilis]